MSNKVSTTGTELEELYYQLNDNGSVTFSIITGEQEWECVRLDVPASNLLPWLKALNEDVKSFWESEVERPSVRII